MTRSVFILGVLAAAGTIAMAPATAGPRADDHAARGKSLVTTMACGDCHTPTKIGPKGPEPDMTIPPIVNHVPDYQPPV